MNEDSTARAEPHAARPDAPHARRTTRALGTAVAAGRVGAALALGAGLSLATAGSLDGPGDTGPSTASAARAGATTSGASAAASPGPSGASAPPPWSERAIAAHVDLAPLAARATADGTLRADDLVRLVAAGESLFGARFTSEDGVGRPLATQAILPTKRRRAARTTFSRTAGLDANACASCHVDPLPGGAGDFSANVFVAEGFSQADFDTTDPQFSNERNTNHLFGAGLVELLAREMSAELAARRADALAEARAGGEAVVAPLEAKGVAFGSLVARPDGRVDTRGVAGVDIDLVVRPFGHKGVMTSLRQFTVNALNHHHGMQAEERFGARWTGEDDHDGDGHLGEIGEGDVSALVAWQATLPPPGTRDDVGADWRDAAARGRERLDGLGCTACHRAALPLDSLVFADPGPLDAAGTLRGGEGTDLRYDLAADPRVAALPRDGRGRVLVPLFGDLKRHVIADAQVATLGNELLSQRFVERDVFMTTELWGVGSTAPYGHRGDLTTLAEAIAAHGGEARTSRDAWLALDEAARGDVVAFLRTLVIEP